MEVAKDISNGTAPDVYAMDDGFTDVDTDFAASGKDVGASLPSVEEVRNTVHMKRGSKSAMSFNTIMAMTVVACVIIAASLGLAVGVSNKNKRGSSEQSSLDGSLDKGGRKSDINDVINYMVAAGVSSEISLRTQDTPQHIALSWLALYDEANTAVPDVPITDMAGYKYMTRYVLAVVYFSLGGENWNFQAGFGTITNVCSWNQIKFDGSKFYRQGVLCDSRTGLIFALDLGTWIRMRKLKTMTCVVEVVDFVTCHITCSSLDISFISFSQIPTILSVRSHQRLVLLILSRSFQWTPTPLWERSQPRSVSSTSSRLLNSVSTAWVAVSLPVLLRWGPWSCSFFPII